MDDIICVVSNYHATGEGHTISILITLAEPRDEDYKVQPSFDLEKLTYHPGILKNKRTDIALREMEELIGEYLNYGSRVVTKEYLLKNYRGQLPEETAKLLTSGGDRIPSNIYYFGTYHINYA